jgi:POT family proton-dependent oligopeptide transporter
VLSIGAVGNLQIYNAYLIWAQEHAELSLLGFRLPVPWLVSFDTIISVAAVGASLVFWRVWARFRPEPQDLTKMTAGLFLAAGAVMLLSIGSAHADLVGGKVAMGWLLGFHILNSLGIANVAPIGLAFYSRVAPPAIGSTILGVFYLSFFGSSLIIGWLGGLLDTLPGAAFWSLHAGLVCASGVLLLLVRLFFGRLVAATSVA